MCVAQHIQLGIQEKLQDESLALDVSELTQTLPQAELGSTVRSSNKRILLHPLRRKPWVAPEDAELDLLRFARLN